MANDFAVVEAQMGNLLQPSFPLAEALETDALRDPSFFNDLGRTTMPFWVS